MAGQPNLKPTVAPSCEAEPLQVDWEWVDRVVHLQIKENPGTMPGVIVKRLRRDCKRLVPHVACRLAGVVRCGEDRLLVGLQDFQPVREIDRLHCGTSAPGDSQAS